MNILLALYMTLAVTPQESVILDIPSLPGPWDNPLSEHPLFSRFVERLESNVEKMDGQDALIIEAVSKTSTSIPLSLGTAWTGNIPLDILSLNVRNDGEETVNIAVSFVLADGSRIASAAQELPPGEWRLLEYDMLEAKPPQPPGGKADVVRVEIQLQNIRAQKLYRVAFRTLTCKPLLLHEPFEIQPIKLEAQAGEAVKLQWASITGEPVEGNPPVAFTVERNGHVFLKARSHFSVQNGSPHIEPVDLMVPQGCPGGIYSIYADTYRVPIMDQPSRHALLGELKVAEAAPGKLIRASIAPFHGAPTLHLNDEPVTGLTYMTYRLDEKYVRQFADAGVELVSFGTCSGVHPYGLAAPTWPEPDVFDFSQTDARITRILSAHPQARILIRCYMGTPKWWSDANPEECVIGLTPQGEFIDYEEPQGHRPGSWASEKWRADMGEGLSQFMRHLRSASYADHIIGLMVCAGTTEEWMAPGSNVPTSADYSKPARIGFQEWLRQKYGTEEALRAAWNSETGTFQDIEPPGLTELRAAGKGDFLDLPKQQKLSDWWSYISSLTADTIEHFARIIKAESDNEWLCGTFYGYVLQFHEPRIVRAGHLAIDQLTRSPYLDFFSSPTLYSHRSLKPGGYSTFMSLTDSYGLHNKLWWNENDLRTFRVLDVPNTHVNQIDRRQASAIVVLGIWKSFLPGENFSALVESESPYYT